MVEMSKTKAEVVTALADAEEKIQSLRDYIMSSAFRLVESSAKEELLVKAQDAVSEMQPGIKAISEILQGPEE